MSMNYTSLTAAKGVSGAVATWVSYSKLDIPPLVDEAQTILYGGVPGSLPLRCREMRNEMYFTMPQGGAFTPLPTGFLDPVGRIFQGSVNSTIRHKDENFITRARTYTESSGNLGTNPFLFGAGSTQVVVTLPGHGFSQDSMFNTSGATIFDSMTSGVNGTFPIVAINDVNTFVIDITALGTTPSSPGLGGGSNVSYICDNLVQGMPLWFGIWLERINFDMAFFQTTLCRMQYYQSPPLLSSSNQTNFLTNRYPHVLRRACMLAAADFMKDDVEYQKHLTALNGLVTAINIENDMALRGLELDTEVPGDIDR